MTDLMKLARAACANDGPSPADHPVVPPSATSDAFGVATKATKATKAGATDPRLHNPAFRRQVIAARDAAPLADFREALLLGRLVICGNCSRFTFGAEPAQLGQCNRWSVEAIPFVPFFCVGFDLSKTPTAPAFAPEKAKPEVSA